MCKNTRMPLYAGLFLLSLLIAAGSAFGVEQTGVHQFIEGKSAYADTIPGFNNADLLTQPWLFVGADTEPSRLLAQADTEAEGEQKPLSPECAAFAEDPMANIGDVMRAGCEPTLAQMSRLMDNPLGNVAMWINQVDIWVMENDKFPDEQRNKVAYMGILQFPKPISKNWNTINRIVYSVVSQPLDEDKISNVGDFSSIITPPETSSGGAPIQFLGGRTTGFGDLYYVGLVSPMEGKRLENGASVLWGAGLDLGFPTASSDVLGTGKWTAGPAALYAYLGPKWKIGGLWQQYWDYAGDDNRSSVNLSNIQYFIYYSVTDTFSIGAGPNIIVDWNQDSDNRFTVPIGLGANYTINIGKVPIRLGFEVHYSVVRPDSLPAPVWDFRFMVIPAVPSALIPFLN